MANAWIWLPKERYPQHQHTKFDALEDDSTDSFVVAECEKRYEFHKEIASAEVSFSADTQVQLYLNGSILATGPSAVGGDFLGNGKPREWYYADRVRAENVGRVLYLFARIKLCPTQICEFSKGQGGFFLTAKLTFCDGSTEEVGTDPSWLIRKNGAYVQNRRYDGSIPPDPYLLCECVSDRWQAELSPIPVREEKKLLLGRVTLLPGEEKNERFVLPMIYAGFVHLRSFGEGSASLVLSWKETEKDEGSKDSAFLVGEDEYRGFHLYSAGEAEVEMKNPSSSPLTVEISLLATCYPVTDEAETQTSDEALNELLRVCRHTLRYCRQTHHLDSPKHCEPLACTGDYYIESLMTVFSFGDLRLAEFDVERTAQLLRHNDGRMFHTTYSLIWVRMLYRTYRYGGNFSLLRRCRDALDLLLGRFASYVGDNGLVENPPDYMFVDWIYLDSLSLHHPPKALGQTVLNLFYYMALCDAERIYSLLGETAAAEDCKTRRHTLQQAVNALLYDKTKGMYCEGLNTPVAPEALWRWQGENVNKRYYLKHSNVLAAYVGICSRERAQALIRKVMEERIEGELQPYFLHYLLEAIEENGLREEYTLPVLSRWHSSIRECNKGLAEGFYPPEPTYRFDHSHAWGGTPLYSLPKALTGLSLGEAGWKQVRLKPSLLGLSWARVEIPTPYGKILCEMKAGEAPRICAPKEIEIIMEEGGSPCRK